ncbi:MAG: hypothetical protein LBS18_08350 [Clostridiales bacterium]|jgi:hypothetical protein|nr:hypothetical protein [Clostridiales bacterium]
MPFAKPIRKRRKRFSINWGRFFLFLALLAGLLSVITIIFLLLTDNVNNTDALFAGPALPQAAAGTLFMPARQVSWRQRYCDL